MGRVLGEVEVAVEGEIVDVGVKVGVGEGVIVGEGDDVDVGVLVGSAVGDAIGLTGA